MFYLVSTKI